MVLTMKLILLMCILFIGDVAHAMTSSEQKQATESKNTAGEDGDDCNSHS